LEKLRLSIIFDGLSKPNNKIIAAFPPTPEKKTLAKPFQELLRQLPECRQRGVLHFKLFQKDSFFN